MKNLKSNKKTYIRPTLKKIGEISNLTLAGTGSFCDNAMTVGSGNKPARCP